MYARVALLALAALLLAACPGSGDKPSIGHKISYTPPAELDPSTLPLPKSADGSLMLISSPGLEVRWAPPTPGPITAVSRCTRWVVGCVSTDRHLDDCALSVPACATDAPWNEAACCPRACFDRYAAARTAGTEDIEAFAAVYFAAKDSCFPGLSAQIGGGP